MSTRHYDRVCHQCGVTFIACRTDETTCSPACRTSKRRAITRLYEEGTPLTVLTDAYGVRAVRHLTRPRR